MNANAVGKMCAEVDRAYLAGLIDGDGCIMATIERHGEKKFGFRVRVEIKVTQKYAVLPAWLIKKFKMGRLAKNRTTFDWIVRDRNDVRTILYFIQPYTRLKVRQVGIALRILCSSILTKNHLLQTARLADSLSRFNVRSKNRRKNFAKMI